MKKLFVVLAAMLTFTSTAFAQIGSLSSDLVYTPVTPCRIIDTRPEFGGMGPIAAGTTFGFYAGNSAGFANQGGSATNCGITAGLDTAAVAVNFTVVTPAAAGYITVFPWGGTKPTASTLNYTAGAVVGNSAIVKVSQATYTAMNIFSLATTHVVADIVGYYSKPVATALQCQDTTAATAAINLATGGQYVNYAFAAACPSGFTSVAIRCGVDSNVAAAFEYSAGAEGYCGAHSPTNTQTLSARRTCCRIPGR